MTAVWSPPCGVLPVRSVAVIGVPSSAGAHAPGQERAPAAYRDAGIVELLADRGLIVHDRGDLQRVRWTPDREHPRAQHAEVVAEVALAVATAVESALAESDAVIVLGGDCTIEVGVVSGFLRTGARVGLIYLDAGPDLNVPTAVKDGFLDWMGSAHLLGLPEATPALSGIGPRFPLLQPADVVFAGAVPDELTDWERRIVEEKSLHVVWSDQLAGDPAGAARDALGYLAADVDRVLLHVDVDVIDFLDFPAADFPTINAGIRLDEALGFITEIAHHPKFAALTVCELNPDHVDEEHRLIRTFAAQLASTLPAPSVRVAEE
jgi:arginase